MIGLLAVIGFIAANAAIAPLLGVFVQHKSLGQWWRS